MDDKSIDRGYAVYNCVREQLLQDHQLDTIFIDCRSGNYMLQGKAETRAAANQRFLDMYPGAEILIEQILPDDHAFLMPTMSDAAQVPPH